MTSSDSPDYLAKKQHLKQMMTIYGRKPVLEILNDSSLDIYRLHLAESNKPEGIIREILTIADKRCIDIAYHDRQVLSRISKNSKQDQGVCIDIRCPKHQEIGHFLSQKASTQQGENTTTRIIALDRITNPQNLGMIIRSVCAGRIDGLLIPQKGCAKIDSLVVKASAGTVFKAPIIRCEQLTKALSQCKQQGATIYGLSSHATLSIQNVHPHPFIIYVMGNESEGVSENIEQLCDQKISIPMNNGVESLNVAVTASLLAFKDIFNQ